MRIGSHSVTGSDGSIAAAMTLALVAWTSSPAAERNPTRLPQVVLPTIGLWCFTDQEFQPGGYRDSLDVFGPARQLQFVDHDDSASNQEVTDKAVHDQIQEAVVHARRLGMEIAIDLDVRLVRAAFQNAYPDGLSVSSFGISGNCQRPGHEAVAARGAVIVNGEDHPVG